MKGKLIKLEAVRGFAACYVLLTHLQDVGYIKVGKLSFLFKFGQEAVILFFLLSGFVIHYSFQNSKDQTFTTYFKKRFLRIYIPLTIIFLLNYIIYLNFSKPIYHDIGRQLLANLLMLQDIALTKPNVISIPFLNNGPLWSLSYEWWFYMLYFFITKYFKEKAFFVVSLLAIISSLSYLIYPFFINRIISYMVIWWAGVELAELYICKKEINVRNLRPILLVMFSCLGIMAFNWYIHFPPNFKSASYPFIEVRHLGFAIFAILGAVLWRKTNWRYFDQTIGLFSVVAPISYTIYISHYFLVIYPDYLNFLNNKILAPIIGIIVCLIVSYVVEIIIYPKLASIFIKSRSQK